MVRTNEHQTMENGWHDVNSRNRVKSKFNRSCIMFRIVKYEKGYVVEIRKRKWWGKSYWTYFISVFGIENQPWFHSSYDFAMMSLIDKIKWDTISNDTIQRQ